MVTAPSPNVWLVAGVGAWHTTGAADPTLNVRRRTEDGCPLLVVTISRLEPVGDGRDRPSRDVGCRERQWLVRARSGLRAGDGDAS